MSARTRRGLRHAAALVIGSLFALFVLEFAYRIARTPWLSPTTNPSYVQHDPRLGWSYRPGAHERHKSSEFDVEVEINAQGFRGKPWGVKSQERRRVLVLGDSFAFGWGVSDKQCFTALLEQRQPRWEVLNAAVSGYGVDQRLLLLERLLKEAAPDLVIDVFCANDLFENDTSFAYGKRKPYFIDHDGALELCGAPVPQPSMERFSYALRALAKASWERSFEQRRSDPDREWFLACDLYRAMKRMLGSIPLVIVSDQERLANFALEEPPIHHLDLRPAFGKVDGPLIYPLDGHWTELAHITVAQALEQMLEPLLP